MRQNKSNATLVRLGFMAHVLGVEARWLREEVGAGRIPAVKAGKTMLFDRATVERILLARARKGGVKNAK